MEEEFDASPRKELDEALENPVKDILKNFLKSIKLSRLYPADNPLPLQAINTLFLLLDEFLTAEGELPLVPLREGFAFQGKIISPDSQDLKEISVELRAKSILRFTFYAGLTNSELSEFIKILNLDVDSIKIQGGFDTLLWSRGISSIAVKEGTIKMVEGEELLEREGLSPNEAAFYQSLLEKDESLSLGEQKILFRLLDDPAKLADFFRSLGRKGAGIKEVDQEKHLAHLLEVLKRVSEIITGEQAERQSRYFRNMGEALLALDDEIKSRLIGKEVVEKKIKPVIRAFEELRPLDFVQGFKGVIKEEKDLESLVKVLDQTNLSPAFKEEILRSLPFFKEREKELEGLEDVKVDQDLIKEHQAAVESITHFDTSLSEQEREVLNGLTLKLSTEEISRKVGQILIEMIELSRGDLEMFSQVIERAKEIVDLLVRRGDFGVAREIVRAFRGKLTSKGSIEEYRVVDKALKHFSSLNFVLSVVDAIKSFERESKDFKEAVSFLALLDRESTINTFVDLLGKERQVSRRKMICNILARLGTYEVQVLGSRIDDPRWFLVRNIVNTLGLIGTEKVYPYLEKACFYPDARVRKSAVKAVARLKLPQGNALLLELLKKEEDSEVLEALIISLGAQRIKEARQPLIEFIERGSLIGENFKLKLAAIEALGNLGSAEALPFLQELSKTKSLVWSGKAREIREKAKEAIRAIKGNEVCQPSERRN